jgi:hypothetical protein
MSAAPVTVAALYVETGGAYFDLPGVDPWDEARDARLYDGPHPVVAHPPCQKWCLLAPFNARRIAGYYVGDDGGCFAAALDAVRTWGGVLEHPAYSYAWPAHELPRPSWGGWQRALHEDAWVSEVAQVAYGHAARKRTWLYYVGPDPLPLDWREPPATMQVGALWVPTGRCKWTYAQSLSRNASDPTPPAFRAALLNLARSAARVAA